MSMQAMTGSNLANSESKQIDLIGPMAPAVSYQDRITDGLTQSQFQVDAQKKSVTCPQGYRTTRLVRIKNGLRFMLSKTNLRRLPSAFPLLYG